MIYSAIFMPPFREGGAVLCIKGTGRPYLMSITLENMFFINYFCLHIRSNQFSMFQLESKKGLKQKFFLGFKSLYNLQYFCKVSLKIAVQCSQQFTKVQTLLPTSVSQTVKLQCTFRFEKLETDSFLSMVSKNLNSLHSLTKSKLGSFVFVRTSYFPNY